MNLLDPTRTYKIANGQDCGPFDVISGAMMTDGIRTWHRDGRFVGLRTAGGHHFDLIKAAAGDAA